MRRTAGIGEELIRRVERLLAAPEWDMQAGKALGNWFESEFRLGMTRTPRGQKKTKEMAAALVWNLRYRAQFEATPEVLEQAKKEVQYRWDLVKPLVPMLVAKFTDEGASSSGKKPPPAQAKIGPNTYLNSKGLSFKTFHKYVDIMERIFKSLKGWRKRALTGGVTVNLVGAKDIRAKAVYRRAQDVMLIKAVPSIMKVQPGVYGSFDYIVVHELGHRYETKVGSRMDFNVQRWETTNYSRVQTMSGGEQFAELFATGHYGISSIRGNEFADKLRWFDGLMSGSMRPADVLSERAQRRQTIARVVRAYLTQIDNEDLSMSLRTDAIRLAHANAALRPLLLPLITAAYDKFYQEMLVRDLPDSMQRALKEVKYGRRSIEVKTNNSYSLSGSSGAGKKSFAIGVHLETGRYQVEWGSWGGPSVNDPQNRVDLDRGVRPLPMNTAVIQGSYGGGKPTWATIVINPGNVAALLTDSGDEVELSKEEQLALVFIGTYNSRGRRDEFPRRGLGDYALNNPHILSLAAKGLVKIMGRGVKITLEGTNLRKSRNLRDY